MVNAQEKSKILIVDDVPANIKTMAAALSDHYEIHIATCGQDALNIVESKDIDLILLDVMMPDMDGYEVCRKIKVNKMFAKMPIIFITADTDKKGLTKGIVAGGIYYMTKPVDLDVLQALVMHLILKKTQN